MLNMWNFGNILNDSGRANIYAFFGNISGFSVVLYVWLYKLCSKIWNYTKPLVEGIIIILLLGVKAIHIGHKRRLWRKVQEIHPATRSANRFAAFAGMPQSENNTEQTSPVVLQRCEQAQTKAWAKACA